MSQLSKSSTSAKYITRRIRDAEGNIIVKRYKKRAAKIPIQIPWQRTPSIISGSISGGYAYLVNRFQAGALENTLFLPEITQQINAIFSSLEGIASILLTGSLAVGLGTILGYSLITQGFKVKRWGGAFRQLIAIGAMLLFTTAIFSSFINEAGINRHLDDINEVNVDYNLDNLDSPFYQELLNGLLDLLGPLPDPSLLIATVTSLDGQDLSKLDDTYLWRYRVADTYDIEKRDYSNNYDQYLTDFSSAAPLIDEFPEGTKGFRVSQQYLNPTAGFTDGLLTPWNSIYDSQVDISSPSIEANNLENGDTVDFTSIDMQKDINSRNIIQAALTKSRTSGYFDFDAYYIPEQQENIAQNSITYGDLLNSMLIDDYKFDYVNTRNDAINDAGTLSSIWGASSLPEYYDINENNTIFGDASIYNSKVKTFSSNLDQSVYGIILQVHNLIQNAVLNLLTNPNAAETFSSTSENSGNNEAPPGEDRAFYFWRQIENNQLFGIKDFLVGYVNMLRSLNIPSRLVIGFNSGDINEDTDTISITAGDVSPWVEALIPWENDDGELQFSWGAFNPLPKLSLLINEGRFVYGQNSLGGQPDITLDTSSGQISEINDQIFSLSKMNSPINIGSRITFEDIPAPSQNIELKLLNEQQFLDLVEGGIGVDALNAGTDLGVIQTSDDSDAWGNFSITVFANNTGIFTYEGTSSVIAEEFSPVDFLAGEGERNLYAIVARYGLEFDIIIVGWQLEGNLNLQFADSDVSEVTLIPALGGQTLSYSHKNETLNYILGVTDLDGLPIAGLDLDILWLSPTDLANIETILLEGNTDEYLIAEGVTSDAGIYTFSYETPGNVDNLELPIYTILAWVPGSQIYGYVSLHISDDFEIEFEILDVSNPLDRLIQSNDTKVWNINVTTIFTDYYLRNPLIHTPESNPFETRTPLGLELNYYLVTKQEFTRINDTTGDFSDILENCVSNYDLVQQVCYQLSENNDDMGILDGTEVINGNSTISLSGGVISPNTYYLMIELVYDPDTEDSIVFLNQQQKIGFAAAEANILSLKSFNYENNLAISYLNILPDQTIQNLSNYENEMIYFNQIILISLYSIIFQKMKKLAEFNTMKKSKWSDYI